MALKFNKDKHEYYLDGKRIPGVSLILEETGMCSIEGIPPDRLEIACKIGTDVHRVTFDYDIGAYRPYEDHIEPYLSAYKAFKDDTGANVKSLEEQLHNCNFAGTRDRVFEIDGKTWCIDIKTSKPKRWHRLQTAAYWLLDKTDKRGCLYLDKTGKYRLKEHDDPIDVEIFKNCIKNFYFKKPRYANGRANSSHSD